MRIPIIMIAIWQVLISIGLLLIIALGWIHPKIRKGLSLRWKAQPPVLKQSFWIHCASGEFLAARPLIRLLKSQHPEIPIVVTYFSPSAKQFINQTPEVDYAFPAPFDFLPTIIFLIKKIKPRALLISGNETWPSMLIGAALKKLPIVYFSIRITPKTQTASRFFWLKPFLNLATFIDCSDNETAKILKKELSPQIPIAQSGDLRVDELHSRSHQVHLTPKEKNHVKEFMQSSKAKLILGSTWPEDEKELVPILVEIFKYYAVVLVPHEASEKRLRALKKKLNLNGIRFSLLSEYQHHNDLLIVDRTGILNDFYRYADYAFVGGSFRRKVHTVLEPLFFGAVTFVGPYYHNNIEARTYSQIKLQSSPLSLVKPVKDGLELRDDLLREIQQPQNLIKQEIQRTLHNTLGASHRLFKHLTERKIL